MFLAHFQIGIEQQKELEEAKDRLTDAQAENAKLLDHVKELEHEGSRRDPDKLHDSIGTSTSQADSAVAAAAREINMSKLQDEAQMLREENERLQNKLDAAQAGNAELSARLDTLSKVARFKDAELEAAAKVTQEIEEAKKRIEADLIVAREEKKLIEQVGSMTPSPLKHCDKHFLLACDSNLLVLAI